MKKYDKLIFEISRKGRCAFSLPESDVRRVPLEDLIPSHLLTKEEADLPEVSEADVAVLYPVQ